MTKWIVDEGRAFQVKDVVYFRLLCDETSNPLGYINVLFDDFRGEWYIAQNKENIEKIYEALIEFLGHPTESIFHVREDDVEIY